MSRRRSHIHRPFAGVDRGDGLKDRESPSHAGRRCSRRTRTYGSSEVVRRDCHFARTAGLPIMIKASAGGGGKGLRLVEREEDLQKSFERVTSEAQSFFGDGSVYAEKF